MNTTFSWPLVVDESEIKRVYTLPWSFVACSHFNKHSSLARRVGGMIKDTLG